MYKFHVLSETVRSLENESGYKLENDHVTTMKECLMSGDWVGAESSVAMLDISSEQIKTVQV